MLTRMVFVATAMVLSLSAFAQADRPAREVVGTLTGNNVFVRSNPSTTGAYQCTKLSVGDKVVVLKAQDEWLQIKPVKGPWSVIAKKFVQLDAAGKVGTVQGDNVWVRAAGELCTFANVADYYVWQGQLNKGDTVTILGEAGDYYKIAPPEFATFWIAAKYVDVSGKPAQAERGDAGPQKTRPTSATEKETVRESDIKPVTGTTRTGDGEVLTTVRRTRPAPPATDPQSTLGQVEAVRLEMMAEYKKPIEQRDLRRVIAKFKAIDTTDNAQAAKLVEYYTKYMENQLEIIDEAREAKELIEKQKVTVTRIRATIDRSVIEEQTRAKPKAYNAEGVLQPSAISPGTKFSAKRWVVRDRFTDRITAYVQCTSGDVDVASYVGQYVGAWGAEIYDEHLGLFIVDAQEIRVMKDGEPAAQPDASAAQPRMPAKAVETRVETITVEEGAVFEVEDTDVAPVAVDEDEDDAEAGDAPAVDSAIMPAKTN